MLRCSGYGSFIWVSLGDVFGRITLVSPEVSGRRRRLFSSLSVEVFAWLGWCVVVCVGVCSVVVVVSCSPLWVHGWVFSPYSRTRSACSKLSPSTSNTPDTSLTLSQPSPASYS